MLATYYLKVDPIQIGLEREKLLYEVSFTPNADLNQRSKLAAKF